METVANVNRIFPENGTGFFGTVLMPRNMEHIEGVIKFATAIGWWVSLVPVHITTPSNPRGFRLFDDKKGMYFYKAATSQGQRNFTESERIAQRRL